MRCLLAKLGEKFVVIFAGWTRGQTPEVDQREVATITQ